MAEDNRPIELIEGIPPDLLTNEIVNRRRVKTEATIKNTRERIKTETIIVDTGGRSNFIGLFGEQWATDVKNDILAQFSYGKSRFDLKPEVTTNGGAVIITEDNLLTASTGIATNGTAYVESYNAVRYRPGHTIFCHFTALWTDITAPDTHQWIGLNDGTDGFAIGSEDGAVAIEHIRKGVHTHVGIEDWNGEVNPSSINWDKLNIFRITFGYLGIAPMALEILDPKNGAFKPLHTLYFHNQHETTHIELPYLPISMTVKNNGNNTDVQIRSGSWQGGVMGLCQECGSRGFGYPTTPGAALIKTGVGTTPVVLAGFKNVSTFEGFSNKIRAILKKFTYTPYNASADTLVTVQLVGGATVTGGTYVDIESGESTLQVNPTATGFTGGQAGLTLYATATTGQGNTPPQSTDSSLDAVALGLFLDPGQEYAIIAFTQAGTVDISWTTNHSELF